MEIYDSGNKDTDNTGMDEEKNAKEWTAERLNEVYDDDSENEIILSQYNVNINKDSIS